MKKRTIIELTITLVVLAAVVFFVKILPSLKASYPTVTGEVEYQMPQSEWGVTGHSQGACTDGVYVWWSCGDLIAKSTVDNPDWNNPLAINNHAMTDGTPTDQINGIFMKGDYVYASAPTFTKDESTFYVKWYDKDTLAFVGEQQLTWEGGADTQEGISWSDGYWWVCYYDDGYVSRYNADWTFAGNFNLPGDPKGIQGLAWVKSQLWVSTSWTNNITVYKWSSEKPGDNGKFTEVGVMKIVPSVPNEQSFGVTPYEQ